MPFAEKFEVKKREGKTAGKGSVYGKDFNKDFLKKPKLFFRKLYFLLVLWHNNIGAYFLIHYLNFLQARHLKRKFFLQNWNCLLDYTVSK